MFRSLIIAGTIAATALLAAPAEAKTRVSVYFGVPFYSYQVHPGYRYYDGYGWYDYRMYPDIRYRFRDHRPGFHLTCGQARRMVQQSGYRNVQARDCVGRTYAFSAMRRGNHVIIYVNARSGNIWRG